MGSPSIGQSNYFLLQNVSPQFGHSSSTSPPAHQLPPRVLPVLRYADTGTSSRQLSQGLVVTLVHQSRNHFSIIRS